MTAELDLLPNADLFRGSDPAAVLAAVTDLARELKGTLADGGMIVKIGRGEHVTIDGWQTVGAMVGISPYVVWSRPLDAAAGPAGYEARAEARTADGRVVGAAEAMVTVEERNWKDSDDYALRSMAQTRAMSKALRGPLGFVIALAGMSATPAEEMPAGGPQQRLRDAAAPLGATRPVGWGGRGAARADPAGRRRSRTGPARRPDRQPAARSVRRGRARLRRQRPDGRGRHDHRTAESGAVMGFFDQTDEYDPDNGEYVVQVIDADAFEGNDGREWGEGDIGDPRRAEGVGESFVHLMNLNNDYGRRLAQESLLGYGLKVAEIGSFEDLKEAIPSLIGVKARVSVAHKNGYRNTTVFAALTGESDIPDADGAKAGFDSSPGSRFGDDVPWDEK